MSSRTEKDKLHAEQELASGRGRRRLNGTAPSTKTVGLACAGASRRRAPRRDSEENKHSHVRER